MMKHGGDIYGFAKQPIDFSANVNPLGMPLGVKNAVIAAIDDCCCYPDSYCRKLRGKLAKHLSLPAEMILCGNGASDLIYRLVGALRPSSAMIIAPTFSDYEAALQQNNVLVRHHLLYPEDNFQIKKDILVEIERQKPELLFICNPNNPVGNLVEPTLLLEIIDCCQRINCIVVVDECFNAFLLDSSRNSCLPYLSKYDNLLLLNAFTKIYAMAGLRLGYLCGNAAKLAAIERFGQSWSVSTLAQAAGCAALDELEFVQKTRALINEARPIFQAALENLGCYVFPSEANYLLFYYQADDLQKRLLEQGYLIRSCADYRQLNKYYYRVCVKSKQENEDFIATLAAVLGKDK